MARVTVKFFKIEKVFEKAPDLDVALQSAFASAKKACGREKEVQGQILRLERFQKDNTFYDGEIVRKQTKEIPPEANDNGLQVLSVSQGGGIGHCIAFRYCVALKVLAVQFDNRSVSVNRFLAYLKEFDPSYDFRAEIIVRRDAWRKYNQGVPTKFEIEIASPSDLASVEGPVGSVIESARTLAEISNGPVISLEVKMGRSKGNLAKKSIDDVIKYFTTGGGSTNDVRKLSVTAAGGEGSEIINFLKQDLREASDLKVPDGKPDEHYGVRKRYLKTCFDNHFTYVSEVYGASHVISS